MLQKVVDTNKTYYRLEIGRQSDRTAYMDISGPLSQAIRVDRERGYRTENGPNFALELAKCEQYAEYVGMHFDWDHPYRFDTRYRVYCFIEKD